MATETIEKPRVTGPGSGSGGGWRVIVLNDNHNTFDHVASTLARVIPNVSLDRGRIEGEDPLAPFSPTAPGHLLRSDGFPHVADIMVGSFYDPDLDEGCAFEELISFHGGIGGPQTRPFILHSQRLPPPPGRIIGAAAVHGVLAGWRADLSGPAASRRA